MKWHFRFKAFGVLLLIGPLVYSQAALQLGLTKLIMPQSVNVVNNQSTLLPLTGVIINHGTATINSATVNWTINNGAANAETLTGLNILTDSSYTFTFIPQVSFTVPKLYNLNVWITNPNGGTDSDTTDNYQMISIYGLGGTTPKNILVEEGTGAWCGYCPDGAYILDTLEQRFPRVTGVSLHNSDAMAIPVGNTINSAFISLFPGFIIDRAGYNGTIEQERTTAAAAVKQKLNDPGIATTALYTSYDSISRAVRAFVLAKFLAGFAGDYRLNLYVCENNVTGNGPGYDQQNYLSGDSTYLSTPYFAQPPVITGFEHMRVVRQILGGAWGSAGVIPATINFNSEYYKEYFDTLPAGVNASRVFFAAVVQKYDASVNERGVTNCIKSRLNGFRKTAISYTYFNQNTITVTGQNPLVLFHGDSLYYDNGLLTFELGDTVLINQLTYVFTSPEDSILLYPGDSVIASGLNGSGATRIKNNQVYRHFSFGTYIPDSIANGIVSTEQLSVEVFPNPANDILHIRLNTSLTADFALSLSDITGKLIYELNQSKGYAPFDIQIPINYLSVGTYLLGIKTQEGLLNERVVISR